MALRDQGPHHHCVIIHLHTLWPWGWRGGGDRGLGSPSLRGWVWGLCAVSVVASASVQGLQTLAGGVW